MLSSPKRRVSRPIIEPDAHGQAALLLVESLLHALIEKGTLSNADALEVLRGAAEVKVEVAQAAGESETRIQESLALLSRISDSLESDA